MKNSKKFVSLFSIIALTFGLTLAGCGEKTEEAKAEAGMKSTAEAAAKTGEKDAAALKAAAEKEAAALKAEAAKH